MLGRKDRGVLPVCTNAERRPWVRRQSCKSRGAETRVRRSPPPCIVGIFDAGRVASPWPALRDGPRGRRTRSRQSERCGSAISLCQLRDDPRASARVISVALPHKPKLCAWLKPISPPQSELAERWFDWLASLWILPRLVAVRPRELPNPKQKSLMKSNILSDFLNPKCLFSFSFQDNVS